MVLRQIERETEGGGECLSAFREQDPETSQEQPERGTISLGSLDQRIQIMVCGHQGRNNMAEGKGKGNQCRRVGEQRHGGRG